MEIAQKLAGYTLGNADLLRRAMGKKKKEVLEKEYDRFAAGMTANEYGTATVKLTVPAGLSSATEGSRRRAERPRTGVCGNRTSCPDTPRPTGRGTDSGRNPPARRHRRG